MRFMMLMIPDVYQGGKKVDPQFAPDAEMVERMTRFNEELAKAGALISLDGLHPLTSGARVSFASGKPVLTDGPFIEAKEVLGGYWIIQTKSKAEAVAWAQKVPAQKGDVIEVRQIFELSDFPEDAQKAADSPTVRAQVEKATQASKR